MRAEKLPKSSKKIMTKREKLTSIFFKNTLWTITQSPNHEEKNYKVGKSISEGWRARFYQKKWKKSLKPCNFCGGLDHQRKSNRLCPFYNGGGENATTAIKDGKNVSKDDTNKLSKKRKASPKKNGKKKTPWELKKLPKSSIFLMTKRE